MFSKAMSAVLCGIESQMIYVEADVSYGLPYFELVGYLSAEVKEARERVKTAIRNSGFVLDPKKVIVNLSPADIRKSGTSFDLAIACALLCGFGFISQNQMDNTLFAGELSLDGSVRGVKGILPIVLMARELGIKRVIVPFENAFEGGAVNDIAVYGVHSLGETVSFLQGNLKLEQVKNNTDSMQLPGQEIHTADFADIRGQHLLKRSMEIAAAGMHNMLIVGPPGAGKSMAAKRLSSILPPMTYSESIEVSKIYSVAGMLEPGEGLVKRRPFRSPHHSISLPSLAGGGKIPAPGEISLAHRGVLFLDELTEFESDAMESLRQPLEDGRISINRVQSSCTFPADFMLVAAMNPCRCGYYPDINKCSCSPLQIQRYIGRISRPLLDRIDITVEVKPVNVDMLQNKGGLCESSEEIRKRVTRARDIQLARFGESGILYNSRIPDKDLYKYCNLDEEEKNFMRKAYEKYSLSARGYNKILKVARTIADLDGEEKLKIDHLSEAVFYKSLDRHYWSGVLGR